MRIKLRACLPVAACATLSLLPGCSPRRASLADAFPIASAAAPWTLSGELWSGTFTEAAPALGDDADRWSDPQPARVWLAVYYHERISANRLIARAFEFDSSSAARLMYEHVRPAAAEVFRAGDAGCWTSDGVLFVWGRFVFDVFAPRPGWQNELQAALLAQYIQKQMPPGLPEAPL